MAQLKTQPTDLSVDEFIESIPDESRREDCRAIRQLMAEVTGESPVMWGDSIVGFGLYKYKYASGRGGEWFVAGFAPRKQALTLYIMSGFKGHAALMDKLGKHSTGRSCLYIKRLADIDTDVLRELVGASVAHVSRSSAES